MNKIKIVFIVIVSLTAFFMSFNVSLATVGEVSTIENQPGAVTIPVNNTATTNPTASNASGSTTFKNPLNYTTVAEVLMAVISNLQSFLALIAIIMIIIGGIMYMFSAGNEATITRAKSTIGGALIGLAIVLAAPSFLKQIKAVLGGGATSANADEVVNKALTFQQIGTNVISFLLSIFGILGIIALVVGGVMYVTAYGDEERIETGKKIVTSALIGIVIALGALVLVRQIAALLGAQSTG
jgi:hypothetical protein